ncbi:ComEC/Rec2 family competence protein [Asticcacaulis solisilvae]|uniref:ComEC/Rec2 family competence protein n=1 Tax=Asticcacaulis solisilvae TaxID=1217274 RepID=UPI003FD89457
MRRFHIFSYSIIFLNILCAFSVGMSVCALRSDHVRAPVLSSDRTTYSLDAFVIDDLSSSSDHPRLLLAPIRMDGVAADKTPLRIRVSLRPGSNADIRPGDAVSLFAILNPPPSPLIPGGYDSARTAWFQGIGGVGFVPGEIRKIDEKPVSWRLKLVLGINQLRGHLTGIIHDAIAPVFLDGDTLGGFAAALVTGQQRYIPDVFVGTMRDSGLAHILSISGVHMAIVGGAVFFALRYVMALWPWLALRVSIKKLAAALSIVAILIYLALSGAPAPAVRSAVVAIVAFLAILCDRKALSLHSLAIAALVVMLLTPEAVIQPGFQMSFAATAALLALAEVHHAPIREIHVPWWVRTVQSSIEGLWLSLKVSIVATAATTPFAIAYFNRFSVYGLVSNLFEAPITAVVMPALAIGTILSATPVGVFALRIAACGLWLIGKVAAIVSGIPGAVLNWPAAPDYVLAISFLGVVWACLVRGRMRWLGLVPALSILWWPRLPATDVWIDPTGGNAAIRTGAQAYVLRPKVKRYGFEQWSQRYGLKPADIAARDYDCSGYACTPLPDAKLRIGFWFSNRPPSAIALDTLCLNSDLVVLRSPLADWPDTCHGVNHISSGDFRRLGAMELTRAGASWTIKAAQPLRGHRPWSEPSEAEDQ